MTTSPDERGGSHHPSGPALVTLARDIAVPYDGRGLARAYCAVDANGFRVVFGLDGGRMHSEPVGPAFKRPREAIALADLLNGESA